MTITGIVCLFNIRNPPDPVGFRSFYRRNIKMGAFGRATRTYSDASTEVITPHHQNT